MLICLPHDALQCCLCWSWPSAICAGGHLQGTDGANSLCVPLVFHCCNVQCGLVAVASKPKYSTGTYGGYHQQHALVVVAFQQRSQLLYMHWWCLPCASCTGGVFPSMFCCIYISYSNFNLDCMVELHFVTCTVWWQQRWLIPHKYMPYSL